MLRNVPFTDIILFGVTRVALGFGIGLLVSDKLNRDQRRAAGLALSIIGGLTTVPLAIAFRQRIHRDSVSLRAAA